MASLWHRVAVWHRLLYIVIVWLPLEVTALILSKFIPPVKKFYKDLFTSFMKDTAIKPADYEDSIYSRMYLIQRIRAEYLDISKEAFLGCSAPNPKVLSIEGGNERMLLEFQRKDRPLVLNFGSCT